MAVPELVEALAEEADGVDFGHVVTPIGIQAVDLLRECHSDRARGARCTLTRCSRCLRTGAYDCRNDNRHSGEE